ncbi:hypothetical protein CLOHYLEM_06802 [[Clostridium] hylemonae DSM 15053]|uniref:Uncharacterized protein n=1 Tax=[Clostridium] hylemonae DSM 15053 TaxID=553973 RepID=C0C3Y9_9FIRM|nr:hypothetical protein CLOHYLEM_06802 [[Clostridium] hylemonae DSM 15053]QEK17577.1 hypothetical protein LAJLEIBI_01588 [[Clostridium] hylemonae DSM 15053]
MKYPAFGLGYTRAEYRRQTKVPNFVCKIYLPASATVFSAAVG